MLAVTQLFQNFSPRLSTTSRYGRPTRGKLFYSTHSSLFPSSQRILTSPQKFIDFQTIIDFKHFALFIIYLLGWNGIKSTITVAIYWPIVPVVDDRCWRLWINWWNQWVVGEIEVLSAPVPLCLHLSTSYITWPGLEPGLPRWEAGEYPPDLRHGQCILLVRAMLNPIRPMGTFTYTAPNASVVKTASSLCALTSKLCSIDCVWLAFGASNR
jgi:hypothetical protein